MCHRVYLGAFLTLFALTSSATNAEAAEPKLPKVVLIGDSIRLGYTAGVMKRLNGQAVVVSPKGNGGDSINVLKHLNEWVINEKPDIVHFNCGLHDLKQLKKDKSYQVDLKDYEANLKKIVARLQKETSSAILFATTTPIVDERHAKRGANFDRRESDVRRYNETAIAVMRRAGVPVDDLHFIVERGGAEKMLGKDGTHYTPKGYERLADAVTDCVRRQIIIRRARPKADAVPSVEAAKFFHKYKMERDALVPKIYKNLKVPEFAVPANAAEWHKRRPKIHKIVVDSLGDFPPRPSPQRVRIIARELRNGYTVESVAIDNSMDGEISTLLLVPEKRMKPAPAVLWLHSSTPDKTQILTPHTNGGAEPLGEALVKAGYIVLAPDACWYGERAGTGPSGRAETKAKEEMSRFKLHLWMGRTLWGAFVRDDQIALDYLCSRPEVDKTRIGATGMSMGSTRSWWLAAVDERIAAVVGVACLTRYQNLIAHGQLRAHGVYYFVNGILKHFDVEGVTALIAPRPYLALTGDIDGGSPADGIKIVEAKMRGLYAALDASDRFKNILYPNIGHTYTAKMRAEMLAWFGRWLKPDGAK